MAGESPLRRWPRSSKTPKPCSNSAVDHADIKVSSPDPVAIEIGGLSCSPGSNVYLRTCLAGRMGAQNGGLRRSPRIVGSESSFSVSAGRNGDFKNSCAKGTNASSPDPVAVEIRGLSCSPGSNADLKIPLAGRMSVENGRLRRSPRTVGSESSFSVSPGKNGSFKNSCGNVVNAENCRVRRSPRSFVNSPKPVGGPPRKKAKSSESKIPSEVNGKCFFVGDPVPDEEARRRWPHHYVEQGKKRSARGQTANFGDEEEIILNVKCHYYQANVSGCIFNMGDCAYVKGEKRKPNYVGRILEFFETIEGEYCFTVQWFFRAGDTVMKEQASFHDKKRLFYSDLRNDNYLDCIVSKVSVVQVPPSVDLKSKPIPLSDFYYDMKYSVEYSTFNTMEVDDSGEKSDLSSSNCSQTVNISDIERKTFLKQVHNSCESNKAELDLLDLYSGCGGMSTGLCLGARVAGVNLVTRWAVDFNEAACKTLKLNHPATQVRNESGDDFYELLKEWEILCKRYAVGTIAGRGKPQTRASNVKDSETDVQDDSKMPSGEYEVLKLVDICYGDPTNVGKRGLKFKVRWKGYAPSEDTWETIEELSKCQERIKDFVREGFKSKILPLPGDVDVLCGGPPCQGISGYNRHRNFEAPLDDERNRQIVVFMDIVQFLKPKYVIMENVVDILKFAKGTLGRFALSRLVNMNYQARLGIMAAGSYGLPQFRLRAFLLGCHPYEKLPQFPLPTHEVILRYGAPVEFERNVVAYDEGQPRVLERALVLEDVLSDLPPVTSNEVRDQMPYGKAPQTEFQRYIRTPEFEMLGLAARGVKVTRCMLCDHRPLQLCEDDYLRICQIPRRKGANFRDLPGVVISPNNTVHLDPKMERILLPSGKPLVPDYALNLWEGKSVRPFGRLWWDETVPTILTYPDIHSMVMIHPEQDRVLTIRESARLQGFPDYYRLYGTVKERYRQVGNAVAVPVGRALGYATGLALLKQSGDQPLMTLPPNFSFPCIPQHLSSSSSEVQNSPVLTDFIQ